MANGVHLVYSRPVETKNKKKTASHKSRKSFSSSKYIKSEMNFSLIATSFAMAHRALNLEKTVLLPLIARHRCCSMTLCTFSAALKAFHYEDGSKRNHWPNGWALIVRCYHTPCGIYHIHPGEAQNPFGSGWLLRGKCTTPRLNSFSAGEPVCRAEIKPEKPVSTL